MPTSDIPSLGLIAVALTLASASLCSAQSTETTPFQASLSAPILLASAAAATSALPEAPVPNIASTDAPQSSSSTPDPVSKDPQTGQPAGPQNGPRTANPDAPALNGAHQTKRIAGFIPNYRSVSADQHLPPQTVREKFLNAARDSFDYGDFILAAVQSGFSINGNSYPEFGKGVLGYGRYYWRTLLDTADENFMVGGVVPSALHQDPRFYTLGHGSFVHRALYASTRVLVTRGDDGNAEPNYSEIIGAGGASGISSLYYPAHYRTWTKVGQKWLTSVLIDGADYTFKEFWPDINKRFVHEKD